MARRDDREYREYLRTEQRSQPGCPAREVVLAIGAPVTDFPEVLTNLGLLYGRAGTWNERSAISVMRSAVCSGNGRGP